MSGFRASLSDVGSGFGVRGSLGLRDLRLGFCGLRVQGFGFRGSPAEAFLDACQVQATGRVEYLASCQRS